MNKITSSYSPASLAFLGDAVYEEMVRERLVRFANRPARVLHNMAVTQVRASFQANALQKITPLLNDEELDIIRRGRNSKDLKIPKSSTRAEYHAATAFETLFGWLKLTEQNERIKEIFEIVIGEI
ncbi:MAG: ribonuclease III [Ruminococcus sp.]|jgi:ribonuclease-3 family protein|nr:ribonuclease III [Ruminococcus sp.]